MADIAQRKKDHIKISLHEDVAMRRPTGFERYAFVHQALPEIAFEDVSLATSFLGHAIKAPILVSSMTGGAIQGEVVNRHLAEAARTLGLPMAVGSERILFEHPELRPTFEAVRHVAPDIVLFGNLGAVQLNYGFDTAKVREAVSIIGADGLFFHLNPLQEVIQPGGDTNFRHLTEKIGRIAKDVDFPILVKEVGCGIDPDLAVKLAGEGVSAIDVSGAGGTSWAKIEALRTSDLARRTLGDVFGDWGLPTVDSLIGCRSALGDFPLIASGGIRTGLDMAKAIVLGADLVGVAMPLLGPATRSTDETVAALNALMDELRVAMFLVGARDLAALRARRPLLRERL